MHGFNREQFSVYSEQAAAPHRKCERCTYTAWKTGKQREPKWKHLLSLNTATWSVVSTSS